MPRASRADGAGRARGDHRMALSRSEAVDISRQMASDDVVDGMSEGRPLVVVVKVGEGEEWQRG